MSCLVVRRAPSSTFASDRAPISTRFERVCPKRWNPVVHVTGPFDYLVHVACTGVGELDRTVRSWKEAFGGETNTRILLHEVDLSSGGRTTTDSLAVDTTSNARFACGLVRR